MNKKIDAITYLIVFLFLFIFLFVAINPQLIFHLQQLGFSLDGRLAKEYLQYPGGITEYFSIFLFQFTVSKFGGALIYALLITGLGFMSNFLVKSEGVKGCVVVIFLPVIFATLLVTNYGFPLFYLVVVLEMYVLFYLFKLFLELFNKSMAIGISSLVVLLFLAFYVLGGMYFFIFSVSALLYLLIFQPKKYGLSSIVTITIGLLLPLISIQQLFFITLHDAFFKVKPFNISYIPTVIAYCLIFSLPFFVVLKKVVQLIFKQFPTLKDFQVLLSVVFSIAMIVVCILSFNKTEKSKLEIDYLAYNGEWEQVLEKADQYKLTDRVTQFHINRALFHLRKLPFEMFNYNQSWGIDGLILTRQFADEMLLPSTQLFIDLSYINEAIHWGNEAISQNEYSPQIIEQLIIANFIANKPEQAQTYIDALKKFPFFKSKAYELEKKKGDIYNADYKAKRDLMPVLDFMVNRQLREKDLEYILQDRPQNRMAYEYLMAYYLLNKDLVSFYNYYSIGINFYNGKIPRIYQEALASYAYQLNVMGKEVPSINFDEKVIADFADYMTIIVDCNDNEALAKPKLSEKYKNTYWYYVHFNSLGSNK